MTNLKIQKNTKLSKDEYDVAIDTLKRYRENIVKLDKHIDETNEKKKTFYDFLSNQDKQELVSILLENNSIDKKTIESLLETATQYKPKLDFLHNVTYPLDKRIQELTENKNNSLATYLLENKETINRLTAKAQHENIVSIYSTFVTKIEYKMGEERVKNFNESAKRNNVGDIIDEELGQFQGKKICYNNNNYERFTNCINELKISEEVKAKTKKLLKRLDSLEILDNNANASESPYKEYGFIRFITAQKEFISAINENPTNEQKIKSTLENLKKEEAKINIMYKMIQEELGDGYENMPSNVDSFRSTSVPPCFKNNLSINAKFNSLFIMLTVIKEKNLDIDTFVEKPVESASKAYQESFKKVNVDILLKNKTKGEAILFLSQRKTLPNAEDLVKYSRSFELISKNEKNKEYQDTNNLSSIAFTDFNGRLGRAVSIIPDYFTDDYRETLQNIFMAKKDNEGKVSYLDCYVSKNDIQESLLTNVAYDERDTIIEKINADKDIENTFFETIESLKYFATHKKNPKNKDNVTLDTHRMFYAVQEFAGKIILALDLKGKPIDQKRGYSEKFVSTLFDIIDDYKEIDDLKNFKFKEYVDRINSMVHIIKNRDTLVKNFEKTMNSEQKIKEDKFITEFERINKEIDRLDEQADKIGEKLGKGQTNEEIEAIAAEQRKKFIELQKLQNNRIKELKEDVKKGKISKFYFEKRSEQVMLLENIKDKPAMFMCEDKNYKDFKTYVNKILNKNIKDFSNDELRKEKENHDLLMKKSEEEKRLFILNSVLHENKLGRSKFINFEKIGEIDINDDVAKMKEISSELLLQNQKIQEQIALMQDNRKSIEVNFSNNEKIEDDNHIEEEIKKNTFEKVVK